MVSEAPACGFDEGDRDSVGTEAGKWSGIVASCRQLFASPCA